MVPEVGLEPTRLAAHDFESRSSANSDTLAKYLFCADARIIIRFATLVVKDLGTNLESMKREPF